MAAKCGNLYLFIESVLVIENKYLMDKMFVVLKCLLVVKVQMYSCYYGLHFKYEDIIKPELRSDFV